MNKPMENYLEFITTIIEEDSKTQSSSNDIEDISDTVTEDSSVKPETFKEQFKEDKPEEVISIEESEKIFFIELENIERSTLFTPKDGEVFNGEQDKLPLHGRGRLDNFVVISNSNNFDVTVIVDNREVVDDSYTTLTDISNELNHVSAYARNNQFVIVVTDYPFEKGLHIQIRPRETMIFPRVRIEGILE